ncbi:hypothetical protein [Bradyrhizobium symbiodeficiens]|uniref:Uncharacterized protein n=1 Tax=Bradyrhizobium symbiodeficiens TaxID=1404367 RepID=A0A6G9A8H6_9BRAD|nr:hypothetical protein [Bradyrhizobium symbiodeficiens]QIP08513.1 hypothetical protein HAV00_20620 [Bradyrhizobium symbiodeficiens]
MEYLLYWFFLEFIGCSIARIVIPALSFGQVHVHSLNASPERFKWLGYRRDAGGRVVVARDVAGFIGFIVMIAVFLAIVLSTHPF